jgi:mono/diheme cytochrome c family protein
MGKLLLGVALLLGLGAACVTTRAALEAELQAAPTAEAKGKILYERSCSRCHNLYMPRSFAPDEWRFYVRKYGRRARLRKEDRALVLAYLSEESRE